MKSSYKTLIKGSALPLSLCLNLAISCGCGAADAPKDKPAAEPPKESERDQQQIVALTKEVQGQQTVIAENQTKIDAKLVTIAEALRLARIYAARGK